MDALLDLLDEQAGQPARNAGISLSGGQVALTKPRDGAQLDHEHAATALVDAYSPARPRSSCRSGWCRPTWTPPISTPRSPSSPTPPSPDR